jgi:hypothetical protein
MILTASELEGIRHGAITCAFRRWRRPSVKTGGALLTAIGRLEIREVTTIESDAVTDAEARRAGHASRAALLDALSRWPDGRLYRITFGALGADPRVALRADAGFDEATRHDLQARLLRLDARATGGAWTRRALEAIRDHPGRRAADLCREVGQERLVFKTNVRKLKALGLTESLEVGYRLSPRGAALLSRWGEA